MLNPFPELLTYSLVVPTVFRLVLSAVYIRSSLIIFLNKGNLEKEDFFESINFMPGKFYAYLLATIEAVGGVSLLLGYKTQLSALILSIIVLFAFLVKLKHPRKLKSGTRHYLLLFFMTASLLLLGAGFLAFDLPL